MTARIVITRYERSEVPGIRAAMVNLGLAQNIVEEQRGLVGDFNEFNPAGCHLLLKHLSLIQTTRGCKGHVEVA